MHDSDGIDPLKQVYANYTKPQLDAQYDQSSLVPDMVEYAHRWRAWSAAASAKRRPISFRYGDHPHEQLDLFEATHGAPLHMHVHGGAWKALSKDDAAFVSRGLGGIGHNVAVLDFALASEVHLAQMVAQIRRAFLWLRGSIRRLNAAEAPILVSGHSSGAHLAAALLDQEWWQEAGLTAADFAGLVLASGCYELEPVRLSARNNYLKLSERESHQLSPLHHLPDELPPVHVVWGEGELPEFRRQSRCFAKAVSRRSPELEMQELAGLNHFEVYDCFHDPDSAICKAAHAMIRRPTKDEILNKEEMT